jgi:hypothetical protein
MEFSHDSHDFEVQEMINMGRRVFEMAAPEKIRFFNEPARDKQLALLSLVSRSEVYWEGFVCLTSYVNRRDAYLETPFDEGFRSYAASFKLNSPLSALSTAAYAITQVLSPDEFRRMAGSYEKTLRCLRRCEHDPNPDCFPNCIRD